MLGQYPAMIEGASPQHPGEVFHHHVDEHSAVGKVDEAGLHLFTGSKSLTMPFRQQARPSFCLWSSLPWRLPAYGGRQRCWPANWGGGSGEFFWTSFPTCAQTCERLLKCGCKPKCQFQSGSITDGISCPSKCMFQCVDQRNRIVQSEILKVVFRESKRPVLGQTPGMLIWVRIIRSLPFSDGAYILLCLE